MKRPPLAGWLRHAVRSAWFWITIWVVLVVGAVSVISIMYWDWLSIESNGSTIRNIVLVAAAMIALPLAIWRSIVAERQAKTAQRGLLNERYQKGAEMLGSDILSVRLGGLYSLARLAREYPGGYHTQIMNLLCSFVRNPPVDDGARDLKASGTQLREDVRAAMLTISARSEVQILAEKEEFYSLLDLSGADLHGISLLEATSLGSLGSSDLRSPISSANLEGASLSGANLSGATLLFSNLKGASLYCANLEGASLSGANLSGANLRGCERLTQEQIDQAKADSDNPPKLEGVVDAKTGKPLVWCGRSLD